MIAQASTIAVLRRAPNPPRRRVLFHDFMLSEGQKLLADADFIPASRLVPHPMSAVAMKMVDPARALDQQDKWLKTFDDVILKRAR